MAGTAHHSGIIIGRTFAGQEQVLRRAQLLPAKALPLSIFRDTNRAAAEDKREEG
eukprot:COSAG01_NODE_45457_length_409_cov_0.938710_2_plen_54_part_01